MGGGGAGQASLSCVAGRLLVDTYLAAREFCSKEASYTLTNLTKSLLGRARTEVEPSAIPGKFISGASLKEFVEVRLPIPA